MQLITTTELRTEVPNLLRKLAKGNNFILIHRSRAVGEIIPRLPEKTKLIDPKRFSTTLKKLEPHKTMTFKQLMKNYEHYMMYRHGPNLS